MNMKISVRPRWFGPVPSRNGRPLPRSQWGRGGRRRKWSVRWFAPDGTRPRKTFESKEEAELFARNLNARSESSGPQQRVRPKRITLGAFADEFPTLGIGPRGERLAPRSVDEYRAVLNRFAAFVGRTTSLESITIADATRYLAHLRSRPSRRKKLLSTASVNKHKRNLKSTFEVAVRQLHYLTSNPFAGLRQDRQAQKTLRYVTPNEFEKLLETARRRPHRALWWETLLTLAYTSGARAGELTHLHWSDVDFENDTVRIAAKPETQGVEAWRPKDYDSRVIPLPRRTMDLLTRHHAEASEGSAFVFIRPERAALIRAKREAGSWKTGRSLTNNLTRDFAALVRSAGVPHLSMHDLRRAAITHWARKLPAPVVQELAGHADIKTTLKHYVVIRQEDLAAAREVTAEALAPTPIPPA